MALFIYLLICTLLIINVNCQTIILSDISSPDSYNQYPVQSNSDICNFKFFFTAVDITNSVGDISIIPSFGTKTELLKNASGILFSVEMNQPIGTTYSLDVVANKNIQTETITIQYRCESIDTNVPGFKIVYTELSNIPKTIVNSNFPFSHFEVLGLKYKMKNLAFSGPDGSFSLYQSEPGKGNIFKVANLNGLSQFNKIYKYIAAIGSFKSQVFSILPAINPTSNNSANTLTIIPSQESMVENCYGCSAYFSIKTKNSDYNPFSGISIQHSDSFSYPIYGDSSGITYYGRIISSADDVTPTKISAFSQYGSDLVNFANASIIIKGKVPNILIKGSLDYSATPLGYLIMFTINFNSLDSYDFFPYYYELFNSHTQISSPFCLYGNNQAFTCKASFSMRPTNYKNVEAFTFGSSYRSDYFSMTPNVEINLPEETIIQSLEIIPLYDQYYLYRIRLNGLSSFSFIQIQSILFSYGYDAITLGSFSTFEIKVDLRLTSPLIIIGDIYGRTKQYPLNSYYSISPPLQYTIPKSEINLFSIQDVSFLYSEIDVTNKSVANILYFNFPQDIDRSTIPNIILTLLDPVSFDVGVGGDFNSRNTFFSKFNNDLKMYQIEFKVPANTIQGFLPFSLSYLNNAGLTNYNLPESAQLYIKSSNFDSRGPFFIEILSSASNTLPNYVNWQFTIDSSANGFDYGDIVVRGNMDASIYKFHLTPADIITGDKYIGLYNIKVNIPDICVNQLYVIESIQLFDTQGVKSYFTITESNLSFLRSPLIRFLGEATSVTEISLTSCSGTITPTSPKLLSFGAELVVNPMGDSQSILFKFTAQDEINGLKLYQYPVVYSIAENLKTIECHSTYVGKNGTAESFECLIELPFGFGYRSDIIFSIYGLISNSGNYIGYSSEELKQLNFDYFMSSLSLISKLVITETSSITSNGGDLWIIGKSFGNDNVFIKYNGDTDFTQLPTPTIIYKTALLVGNIKKSKLPFTIKIKRPQPSTVESNEFIITPIDFDYTPPPPVITNAPQTCSNKCGGQNQGYCTSNGCICYSPWIGNDCSSKVLIITQPHTNTTNPSTEIPIGTENGNNTSNYIYKSLISLVSIREFDYNSNKVNEYTFDKWIYNELNSNTNEYYTNITVPSIDGIQVPTITSIKVKIQWFNQSTNITFANEQLTMNPSSIKYTIELSSYKFKSNLNTLQLIVEASLSSSKSNDICSVKEFGETASGDNSNYIKIQISDHSLYGRFIKRAIVDYFVKSISNTPLDSSLNAINSASTSQSFIGINIPNYKSSIIIDPDFSVLVNNNDASNNDNSICNSTSSGLTNSQLAGIIVGAGVIFIAIVSIGIFILIRKRKHTLLILGVKDILMHKTK